MALHRTLAAVTQRIIDRSRGPRQAYLDVTRKNAGRKDGLQKGTRNQVTEIEREDGGDAEEDEFISPLRIGRHVPA